MTNGHPIYESFYDTLAESRGISTVAPRSYGSGGRGESLDVAGGTLPGFYIVYFTSKTLSICTGSLIYAYRSTTRIAAYIGHESKPVT